MVGARDIVGTLGVFRRGLVEVVCYVVKLRFIKVAHIFGWGIVLAHFEPQIVVLIVLAVEFRLHRFLFLQNLQHQGILALAS